MNEYENKIELMNYLDVLWKRKWLIIIATFLLISAAAVVSFLIPPKWEVDAIIEPSKFHYRNLDGIWKEMQFIKSKWIINTINRGAYNERIAAELKLNLKDIPKLTAENLEATYLMRIYIEEKDVEKAKLIIRSLLNNLKEIFDLFADRRIKRFDSQVKSKETEKLILEKKIKAYKNKINIIKQRKREIEKEMSDMRGKKEELEKELRLILEKKNRSESESFTMLHYSNEIHQSSINYIVLNESLGNKKIEEEIINLRIEDNERLINQIEKEINSLKERILNTHYAEITKEPTSSISPVYPKKLTNILIAGILGLLIFGMLAFFLEYIEKQKSKLKTEKPE
jgi:capsular polysaccharide biosynthesis protein